MKTIRYIERATQEEKVEKVYGEKALKAFYGDSWFSPFLYTFILPIFVYVPFFSWLYGCLQKTKQSRRKIKPFIRRFSINSDEFSKKVSEFSSFNDFFIRTLKKEARPIDPRPDRVVFFADARYLFYPKITPEFFFSVKKDRFTITDLLRDKKLAKQYENGVMVMARLCPSDYHRFHFPCEAKPNKAKLINGPLYSVNPWALRKNPQIFTENKRMITLLSTSHFGEIAYIEVGATYVGSIYQTYTPHKICQKGEEKGYFSFGASSIIVLFEPGKIALESDLLSLSRKGLEVRVNMGETLGQSITGIN